MSKKEIYANLLFPASARKKGMNAWKSGRIGGQTPLLFGLFVWFKDMAMRIGEIAGAQNFTSDVLRPALQIIKTQPGISARIRRHSSCLPKPPNTVKTASAFCRLWRHAQSYFRRIGHYCHCIGSDCSYHSEHGTPRCDAEFLAPREVLVMKWWIKW